MSATFPAVPSVAMAACNAVHHQALLQFLMAQHGQKKYKRGLLMVPCALKQPEGSLG